MRRADRHEREKFIDALCAAVPTATRADALRLLRWGSTYGRLCEQDCNGDDRRHDDGSRILDSEMCRAERIIRETCERMNLAHGGMTPNGPRCVPHFAGDPRGYTVRLQIAGAALDVYERPALAVPTS